jgi:hypothetical protein
MEFEDIYKPVEHAKTDTGDPILLETYGQDLSVVQNTDPHHVWTVLEGDTGLKVVAGYHTVNRMNYITTEIPWVTGEESFPWD